MLDRFEIFYSRARRAFSRNRWTARLLGSQLEAHIDEPGLVLIQIDGLGEPVLRRALQEGRMPFIRRLVEADGYTIRSLYSGLPSTTSGFQAELFYGVRTAFPGPRYRDPDLGDTHTVSEPGPAGVLEARLAEGKTGLLRNGSSWANLFAGGAKESHLCAATAGFAPHIRDLAPNRVLRFAAWHAWNMLRVAGNVLAAGTLVLGDALRGRLPWRQVLAEMGFLPIQVTVSTGMRELAAAGASVDAERGIPIIHLSFLGYDEYAHRRGPGAGFSLWMLRGIDRAVRRVWMAAHRSRLRDYQVWIFSDHGHEEATSYQERYGRPLAEVVETLYHRQYQESKADDDAPRPGRHSFPTLTRFRWMGVDLPRWLRRRGAGPGPTSEPDPGPGNGIEVVAQGPLGFVYLDRDPDPSSLDTLAAALVREGNVPAVVLASGVDEATVHLRDRTLRLPRDAGALLEDSRPSLEAVTQDLIRQAHHPGAGHLMLLGWGGPEPLTFQKERGSHGGPGPGETSAFVILPPEARIPISEPHILRPGSLRAMALCAIDPVLCGKRPSGTRAGDRRPGAGIPLRIMTYNVHGCRGMDGKFAPQRIARVIAAEEPDVVCLQELDQERRRSGGVNQAQVIADRLEADYHFHAAAELDDGRFGNAVISRHPLRFLGARPLPSAPRAKSVLGLEDRGALSVLLSLNGIEIRVVNTHLSVLAAERRVQIEALLGPGLLGEADWEGPLLLAGDLNASPRSWTVRQLESRLRNVAAGSRNERALRTWSGRTPLRRIDHILVSDHFEARNVFVPRTRLSRVASDHLPLVVDLVCYPTPLAATEPALAGRIVS